MIAPIATSLPAHQPFLNMAILKEGVKKISGLVSVLFGVIVIGAEIASFRTPNPKPRTGWGRVILVAAKISIFCAALSSPWVVYGAGWVFGKCFPRYDLGALFGPNTTFALNPYHPRHILAVVGSALGLIVLVHKLVKFARGIKSEKEEGDLLITNRQIISIAAFNTLFNRTALHLVNVAVGRVLGFRW
jgi:hypothetical protein